MDKKNTYIYYFFEIFLIFLSNFLSFLFISNVRASQVLIEHLYLSLFTSVVLVLIQMIINTYTLTRVFEKILKITTSWILCYLFVTSIFFIINNEQVIPRGILVFSYTLGLYLEAFFLENNNYHEETL